MMRWLLESIRRESLAVAGSALLLWLPVCLFLLSLPLSSLAENPQIRPIRSVKIINQDEAGLSIRFPASLAYDPQEDEIYLSSPLRNKLVILTADYFPYLSIGPGRGLEAVSGSYLKDGFLYVCVGSSPAEPRPHISVFDSAFLPKKKIFFDRPAGFSPLDLVVGATGNLYVVGFNGTGVVVLDPDGNYLRTIEPRDEVLGVKEKATILALDVGQDGKLYFVSEAMGRVYVYDKSERFLFKFGEKGGEAGKLSRPRGIAVDDFRQQIYLVDYQRHTVPVYASTGEYLFEIGGLGEGRGWFYYPNDVLVDGQGRILVADTFNHRVQVFEFVGGPAPAFGQPGELLAGSGQAPAGAAQEPELETVAIAHVDIVLPAEAVGDYLVLTSISRDQAAAQQLADQLAAEGLPVHVVELDRGARGIWQQVFVGPYEDPLDAWRVADILRNEQQLPAILKTRGEATELKIPSADGVLLVEPLAASEIAAVEPVNAEGAVPMVAADAQPQGRLDEQYRFPTAEQVLQGEAADFRMPADEIHTSFHGLPFPASPLGPPAVEVAAVSEPATGVEPVQPPLTQPESESVEVAQQVQAAALAAKQSRAEATVDFCVACHDQRIAKVCLQCHPRERKDRM